MSRRVLACTLLLVSIAAPASAAKKKVKVPAGDAFYVAPKKLLKGAPGTVIWSRRATGLPALKAAGRTDVVLFRSRSLTGAPIAESGTVSVPKGPAPAGGWPLVSWFHVTTGAADNCAPSRAAAGNTELERMTRADQVVSHLLDAGIAVARPDGEGIGTPGGHPYLIGASLARSQADMARAARRLNRHISKRWAAAGHSEGGVASLWSGQLAQTYAPELQLKAVAAFAPVTRTKELLSTLRFVPTAAGPIGGLTALASLIITGAVEAEPALRPRLAQGAMSEKALQVLPHVDSRCLNDLGKADSWGGIAPAEIPGPRYDSDFKADFERIIEANDARHSAIPKGVPVRIDQGLVDLVEPFLLTEDLVLAQQQRGTDVTYTRWPSASHVDITNDTQAGPDAVRWLVARLGR